MNNHHKLELTTGIGGALPEDIPADEHIKEVEKRIKTATPKLELDERDATGLRGENKDK